MSLQLHHPDERGVMQPEPGPAPDYRDQLRSPRWGAARRGGRLPAMGNPEMRPTSRLVAVGFWLGLGRSDDEFRLASGKAQHGGVPRFT